MTYPVFTNGTVLPASDLNAIGLWLVSTTTVGSGVSSVNVTSCFSSTFDNYLVTISGVTSSGGNGGTINYKLLSGTTATASGFYGNTFYITVGGGGGLSNAPFSNSSYGEFCSISTSSLNNGLLAIQAPYLAQNTRSQATSADNNYYRQNAMVHTGNTSYDGIQILPSAGTITGGTIRVYGFRN